MLWSVPRRDGHTGCAVVRSPSWREQGHAAVRTERYFPPPPVDPSVAGDTTRRDRTEGSVEGSEHTGTGEGTESVETGEGSQETSPVRSAAVAGLLLAVVGLVAWGTGEPFVFPSLGPTAYALATGEEGTPNRGDVFWAHAIGLVAGLVAFHGVVAPGVVESGVETPSLATFRGVDAVGRGTLALAGTLSVAGTTLGMLATGRRHAPACATTLIVSLGLLTSPRDAVVVVAAVATLLVVETVGRESARALADS